MDASLTPVRMRGIAVLVIVGFGGLGIALANRGNASHQVTVATSTSRGTTSTVEATTTKPSTTTTVAPTTTTAVATTTSPPVTVAPTVAPTTAAPIVAAGVGSLAGKTITIDPGHDGGNYAHAAEINRQIFIGTQSRACDTTGTQ